MPAEKPVEEPKNLILELREARATAAERHGLDALYRVVDLQSRLIDRLLELALERMSGSEVARALASADQPVTDLVFASVRFGHEALAAGKVDPPPGGYLVLSNISACHWLPTLAAARRHSITRPSRPTTPRRSIRRRAATAWSSSGRPETSTARSALSSGSRASSSS